MSVGVLLVEIDNRPASLVYNTKTWTLTLRYHDSASFEFEINMDNIKSMQKCSSYNETHFEDKNKLARTIIGGVLFGVTGAIVGAVSGEGRKEVIDANYSYIRIETYDNKEIILVCKEQSIANNSWVFIQNFNDSILKKQDPQYQKRKKQGVILGVICLIIIIASIIICNLDL